MSNSGDVFSVRSGKVLLPERMRKGGHLRYRLTVNGVVHRLFGHYLVLLAFVGDRPEGMDIRHLDGDPENNKVENLMYGTRSENTFDAVRHGTNFESRKTACPFGHEYIPANIVVRQGRESHRDCKSCGRARAYIRIHPEFKGDLITIGDRYFSSLAEA